MENISREYDAVVECLADRARLIKRDNKNWDTERCIRQAIDDGFYYYDDKAYVLAWSYLNGLFKWGEEVCWDEIEENLVDDISNELLKEKDNQND